MSASLALDARTFTPDAPDPFLRARAAAPAARTLRAMTSADKLPVLPRVASGEEAAVKECVERYGPLVYAIARRFARDPGEVDDACQDIFVALWKSAGSFDPSRASEATFIAVIARRRLVDRLRVVGTRKLPAGEAPVDVSESSLERYVDARVAVRALDDCSEEQRRVVGLSLGRGLTFEEIAAELAIPLGTAKSHYTRAIDRVRRALGRGEQGPS